MPEAEIPFLRVDHARLADRRKWLNDQCEAIEVEREDLERQAGIDTKRLRENWSSISRKALRRLYFAVADFGLRDGLITLDRREYEALVRFWEACIEDAEATLGREKSKEDRPLWTVAALCAGACVAIAYVLVGIPGAIGGSVVGFFIGQGVISRAQASARTAIEDAQRELDAERAECDKLTTGEIFSAIEAAMGEPDFASPERADFDAMKSSQ